MDFGQRFRATRWLHLAAAMLALSIVAVGGCTTTDSSHPVQTVAKAIPWRALLRRQPEPDCAFRGPVSDPITAEETRQKLDYEQQCYRASERIARARLEKLQDAVREMIKVAGGQ
jgi:hypothetical protein